MTHLKIVFLELAWMGSEMFDKYSKYCGADCNSCTVSTYSFYIFVTT